MAEIEGGGRQLRMRKRPEKKFRTIRFLSRTVSAVLITAVILVLIRFYHLSLLAFWSLLGILSLGILLLGRTWCGFCCPVGFALDIITRCAVMLHIPQLHRTEKYRRFMDIFQYPFCIAYIIVHFIIGYDPGWFLVVLISVPAPFVARFWCSFCPIGMILGWTSRISPVKLQKDGSHCIGCRACYEACPMRCKKVLQANNSDELGMNNCIMCGECIDRCPEPNALSLTLFGKTIHHSAFHTAQVTKQVHLLPDEEAAARRSVPEHSEDNPWQARQQERFLSRNRMTASKYLQKLNALPGAPDELRVFTDILHRVYVDNQPICYQEDQVYVGTFCAAVPPELIYAAGARPIRLCCGTQAGAIMGESAVPRDACPLIKSVAGHAFAHTGGIFDACGMYVIPATCDCKKKLASTLDTPDKPAIPLYVPLNRADDNTIKTYAAELKSAADIISGKTGIPVTRGRLENSISVMNAARTEVRRLMSFKALEHPVIRGSHIMAAMNASAYEDISEWTDKLKKLNDCLEERARSKEFITRKKLPRILLAGSPIIFPNYKIPLLIEEQGGLLVSDDTCLGDRALNAMCMPAENTAEGCYRALANGIGACTCPVFSDNSLRARHISRLIEEYRIDGIVYHVLRSCVSNDYDGDMIEQVGQQHGIPVIRLESDYSDEDIEQLRIRIEAFLEMIKFKGKRNHNE